MADATDALKCELEQRDGTGPPLQPMVSLRLPSTPAIHLPTTFTSYLPRTVTNPGLY